MASISPTMFSDTFSWTKSVIFWLQFHWSLFLRVQLTIFQHWFRWWLGADQATSHYLNQCWPDSLTHICDTRGRWINCKSDLMIFGYFLALLFVNSHLVACCVKAWRIFILWPILLITVFTCIHRLLTANYVSIQSWSSIYFHITEIYVSQNQTSTTKIFKNSTCTTAFASFWKQSCCLLPTC